MTAADFPLNPAARDAVQRAFATTQGRWGMCLLKGFPVDRWSEEDSKLAYWGVGLHAGVARTQNPASQYMNDVRDEGAAYKAANGRSRGYNTKAGLDFHMDSSDVVALLCRRTAKVGRREPRREHDRGGRGAGAPPSRPAGGAQAALLSPLPGLAGPSAAAVLRVPDHRQRPRALRDAGQPQEHRGGPARLPEVPRVTPEQWEALDLLEEIMADPRWCFRMQLEQGDMQLVNNYAIVHSRTPFEDFEEPDRKRHLLRLWLAVPGSQPLPVDWAEYFIDTRPSSVRGGLRGSQSTAEFASYERRQAAALGMAYRTWAPVKLRQDVPVEARA
jgi:hypothetical protein